VIELAASFDTQYSQLTPFLIYLITALIIFAETGILLGFFLPGDSVLFSAGLVTATRSDTNIAILVILIFMAAFLGDQVGYVLGRMVGRPYLERKPSPRMRRMVARSEKFYGHSGWWAVVAARFFPWVRSFVPPIAGAAKMNYYKFLSANALGALLWGVGVTLAGYYSARFPWVKQSSYAIAAFFISASLISATWNYFRAKRD
jgi:membrane-associated protein